jgi:hypothetical protein
VLQVVEADADGPSRFVERRPDVGILAELVAPDGLDDQPDQLVHGRHGIDQQDPARLADALDVLTQKQPEEGLALLVPVRADALERGRPVHERVGHDVDVGVAEGDELALEVARQVIEPAGRRDLVAGLGGLG